MSVFADTQSGHWPGFISTNPFGWDSLHSSSPFRGFRSGLGLFDNDRDNADTKPSKMRLRNTLGHSGFYDHFADNVFHDHRRCDAASTDSSGKRQSSEATGRGKEYVIPIKIERVSSSSDNSKPNTRGSSVTVAKSPPSPSAKLTLATLASFAPSRGLIEIPIIRETSDPRATVNRSSGRDNTPAFSLPSSRHFKLLTPTTDQGGHRQFHGDSSSKHGDTIYMDSEDFFPSKSSQSSDNCDVIEIEEEEEETVTTRRKSPRHISNAAGAAVTSNKPAASSRTESTSSPQSSTSSSNIRSAENVTFIEIKSPEKSREAVVKRAAVAASQARKGVCSAGSSGTIEVTPTPSYPIYDYLKPRLASIERQLDYIRGDGNCFFRALSKEMYGSEEFHAEWRQAVVDVIESHPHVFRQYIDGENVQDHVADMSKAGSWATTCEIYAAATLLQREIYVLAPSPTGMEYNWLLFSPRALPGASSSSTTHQTTASTSHGQAAEVHPCYLTLCYTNGNHYDRITPVFARCNCEMAPPCLSGLSLLVDLTDEDGRKIEIK